MVRAGGYYLSCVLKSDLIKEVLGSLLISLHQRKRDIVLQEMKHASNKTILCECIHGALKLIRIFLAVNEHLVKKLNLTFEKFNK